MNKTDILSRSRQENAKGDEFEKYNKQNAEYKTLIILMTIISFIYIFLDMDIFSGALEIQNRSIPLKILFSAFIGIFLFFECLFKFQYFKKEKVFSGHHFLVDRAAYSRERADFMLDLILKNNIKEARKEKNLTQQNLADLIGVSRNTICSIENGQFNPTAKLALILCIALDKNFEELFYFDDE